MWILITERMKPWTHETKGRVVFAYLRASWKTVRQGGTLLTYLYTHIHTLVAEATMQSANYSSEVMTSYTDSPMEEPTQPLMPQPPSISQQHWHTTWIMSPPPTLLPDRELSMDTVWVFSDERAGQTQPGQVLTQPLRVTTTKNAV